MSLRVKNSELDLEVRAITYTKYTQPLSKMSIVLPALFCHSVKPEEHTREEELHIQMCRCHLDEAKPRRGHNSWPFAAVGGSSALGLHLHSMDIING